jgi:hypothetical protein
MPDARYAPPLQGCQWFCDHRAVSHPSAERRRATGTSNTHCISTFHKGVSPVSWAKISAILNSISTSLSQRVPGEAERTL